MGPTIRLREKKKLTQREEKKKKITHSDYPDIGEEREGKRKKKKKFYLLY